MPNGASIFEAAGAWEDYSTPARDFRLLIAIDVVRGFPDHVARRADRFAMPAGKSAADVKRELQGVLASELASRKITYTRSDGSPWTLSLKDVIDRAADFEMAYNPNDCVELRWGADGRQRRSRNLQAPRAGRAARQDVVGLPRLVPRAALADAWVGVCTLDAVARMSQRVGAKRRPMTAPRDAGNRLKTRISLRSSGLRLLDRHCERSEAIQPLACRIVDCFVAALLAMTT